MKKVLLFLCLVLVIPANMVAVNENNENTEKAKKENAVATYSLTGTIFDRKCNETVAGAVITVDGNKYYSDFSGKFTIPELYKGRHTVSVDFVSYQSQTMIIDLDNNRELMIDIKQQ